MAATKTTRKRTPKSESTRTFTMSQAVTAYAKAKNLSDVTKAGKLLRSRVRANFDHLRVTHNWPSEAKQNRDGNRYEPMPESLFREIEKGNVPSAAKAGQ